MTRKASKNPNVQQLSTAVPQQVQYQSIKCLKFLRISIWGKCGSGPIFPQLSNVRFAPFSDYALHHMGSNLTDGVNQGVAGPDEFRTAPLWGVGQRLFFMHDGRDTNLIQAILDHESSR